MSIGGPLLTVTYFHSEEEQPRCIKIDKGQELLGITIVGGEPNGIFVSSVTAESYASKYGLKYGDQLLEVCVC